MNHLQRRVRAAVAVYESQSAEQRLGLDPVHPDKYLPAREVAAGDKAEGGKLGIIRQVADLGFDMESRLIADHSDVHRLGALGERHDRRGVSLDPGLSAIEHLDERGARARLENEGGA